MTAISTSPLQKGGAPRSLRRARAQVNRAEDGDDDVHECDFGELCEVRAPSGGVGVNGVRDAACPISTG